MLYSKPELVVLAVQIAREFELDPALVCSHIDVRSKWQSGLTLPTATYYSAANRSPLESEHRSTVWGLMAISGEFARSHGYSDPLQKLLDPSNNLREGCKILANLVRPVVEPSQSAVTALLAWNREQNRELAAQILLKLEAYRELLARIPLAQSTFPDACKTLLQEHSQIATNQLL